ncbi:hypothetical protein ZIOFF_035549 [Zingiber officinale]|uniref:Uncharacterized protein n=1 Tax=Zingiber officinale TaxID=94328 RepID=A0A8J5G9D9_ZINOF|nr:hypothetical protein ZIOFF_035549 [Zingiber officinale]
MLRDASPPSRTKSLAKLFSSFASRFPLLSLCPSFHPSPSSSLILRCCRPPRTQDRSSQPEDDRREPTLVASHLSTTQSPNRHFAQAHLRSGKGDMSSSSTDISGSSARFRLYRRPKWLPLPPLTNIERPPSILSSLFSTAARSSLHRRGTTDLVAS